MSCSTTLSADSPAFDVLQHQQRIGRALSGSRNSNENGAETCSGARSSIFASIFMRLCAWRALVALARKRLMNDSRCARSRCCFSI